MKKSLFWVKVFNYEYWSWWVFYLPMAPYWLYLAARSRSLTFFTAANPGIEAGGFYGEKKKEILEKISPEYLAKTVFIEAKNDFQKTVNLLIINELTFPIIAKPNIGERGFMVTKIENFADLETYKNAMTEDFIMQEFVSFDLEFGVLYSRLPNEKKGKVSSLTMKEFLSVTGDGISTIEQLLQQNTRARFQLASLQERMGVGLQQILPKNEKRLLEPIGNHCRGTKFINANHLITNELHEVFDKISESFDGFFYGRFDMKVKSLEDFYAGKNIKIMELNGVSSDPGHIYDPDYKLLNAYKDLRWHWKRIADISILNQKNGIKPLPLREVFGIIKQHFA